MDDKLQMYLAVKKLDGLSPKTLKNYQNNLLIFESYIRKPLATITVTDIRIFLANRCKNLKQTSSNGQITILKSFFSWLLAEEYIPKNPMLKIKPMKEPKRLRHAMTEEDVENLRQACITDREKALVEFLISTGCRLSEVVGIDKDDIDWHEMSLNVIGKGNKERTVYFNTKAKILLQKYILSRKGNGPALFISNKAPYGRLGGRAIEKEIKAIAARAGIDKPIYPHLFRHTFATEKINSGMPLHILQQILGHEQPDTTLIYAEVSQDNIQHEYRKIS